MTRDIAVTPVNDAPVLAGIEGGLLSYTPDGSAVPVTATITVSDVDNTNLAGATIQITGNYHTGEDVLSFINTTNITGTWNAADGELTLTGSDTVANYQAALRAVKYEDSSAEPEQRHAHREFHGQRRRSRQQRSDAGRQVHAVFDRHRADRARLYGERRGDAGQRR